MSLHQLYQQVQEKNIRLTKGKKAVLECLHGEREPLSAQEIHARLSLAGIDLATVYRNLEALEKLNLLAKIEHSAKGWKYFLAGRKHSHAIHCIECGGEVSLGECMMQGIMNKIQEATGYSNIQHVVQFSGNCPQCQAK